MLEIITTCVNYSDYLACTLPHNQQICDKMIVVTSKNDIQTQEVCSKYRNKVKCLVTDCFFENKASFNKAKGINLALKNAQRKGWLLIIDADIVLPKNLYKFLPLLENKNAIYSMKRNFCLQKNNLNNFIQNLNSEDLPATIVTQKGPHPAVGYFQLFHNSSNYFLENNQFKGYLESFTTAAGCDLQFSKRWPETETLYLNSMCTHLGKNRHNWDGRISEFF